MEFNGKAKIPSPKRWTWRVWTALALIALPTATVATYEYGFAADQYVTKLEFIVRQQVPMVPSSSSILGALSGGGGLLAIEQDSQVVTRYISSPQIIHDIRDKLSLASIYGGKKGDFWSRMSSGDTLEQQRRYWSRMVDPYFDMSSGIVTVKVRAFTPQDARKVANVILASSEALVNKMSDNARQSSLKYAEHTVAAERAIIENDERKIANYRSEHNILDPRLSAQSTTMTAGTIATNLAQDRASLASLKASGQTVSSPQVQTLERRIKAETAEVAHLDHTMAGGSGKTLAKVMEKYDVLVADEAMDQKVYASDLVLLQEARSKAQQKQVYLENFVGPFTPVSSTYPIRWLFVLETLVASAIAWFLTMLVVQAIAQRMD